MQAHGTDAGRTVEVFRPSWLFWLTYGTVTQVALGSCVGMVVGAAAPRLNAVAFLWPFGLAAWLWLMWRTIRLRVELDGHRLVVHNLFRTVPVSLDPSVTLERERIFWGRSSITGISAVTGRERVELVASIAFARPTKRRFVERMLAEAEATGCHMTVLEPWSWP